MKFFVNLFKKKKQHIVVKEKDNLRMEFDVTDENNPKPLKATVSLNVLGEKMSFDYDFSEKAEKERAVQREKDKATDWTIASGDRLTWVEKELIGDYPAYKKYSKNGLYCAVFVREFVKNKSTGKGRLWLVDCTRKMILLSVETNIIDEVFVLNKGVVVVNQFKREVISGLLKAYDSSGKEVLVVRKRVNIQLDDVVEPGIIQGHFLDKKYTEFIFEL